MKYPGAKWKLSSWIISHFPEHRVYVEPYFGSGAILFNKEPVGIETVNDKDSNVVNLFQVIRECPEQLAQAINMTPWARDEYYASYEPTTDNLEQARRFLVRCWQAYATRIGTKTGWRHSAQGQCPNMPEQWGQLPRRITEVAQRLKHVQIENRDALELIEKYNNESCLIYLDPPYMHGTRQKGIYSSDGTEAEHISMLSAALKSHSKILISGYDSPLYRDMLKGWNRETHMSNTENASIKQEVIWWNYSFEILLSSYTGIV